MVKNQEIPKVINYFWFGKKELPKEILECIQSWKEKCPNYKIRKWDESNFDIRSCDYISEAYDAHKWAFVSDYARFKILYENGGIYLDTDVKLIKSLDTIVNRGAFFALENDSYDSIGTGLGMGTPAHNTLYKQIVDYYEKIHFKKKDGSYDETPINLKIKKYFIEYGLKDKAGIQKIKNITIYPKDYFCPLDYETGKLKITSNTVAIHLYLGSWLSPTQKFLHNLQKKMARFVGNRSAQKIVFILNKVYLGSTRIQREGIKKTILYYIKRKNGKI